MQEQKMTNSNVVVTVIVAVSCFLGGVIARLHISTPVSNSEIEEVVEPDDYPDTQLLRSAINASKTDELTISSSIIDKDMTTYENPIYVNYIKAVAFRAKADAEKAMGYGDDTVFSDVRHAADLGSIDAAIEIVDKFAELLRNEKIPMEQVAGNTIMYKYALFSATLGYCGGINLLSIRSPYPTLSKTEDEAIFWRLSEDLRCNNDESKDIPDLMQDVFLFGSDRVLHVLNQYSPVGPPYKGNNIVTSWSRYNNHGRSKRNGRSRKILHSDKDNI
jgi:hypothetical protein